MNDARHQRRNRRRSSNSQPTKSDRTYIYSSSGHLDRVQSSSDLAATNLAATAKPCDRRLSRAARELVRRHFEDALARTITRSRRSQVDNSLPSTDWNVWQLLEFYVLEPAVLDPPNCLSQLEIWDPRRDIWKTHEEQSLELSYTQARQQAGVVGTVRSSAVLPGAVHVSVSRSASGPNSLGTGSSLVSLSLHQCGMCGKIFISRYYLDRHFDVQHTGAKMVGVATDATSSALGANSDVTTSRVCPADAWCQSLLSELACHELALVLEPWYGPGSGGRGPDHRAVHHALSQGVPPCRSVDLQQTRQTCRRLVNGCDEEDWWWQRAEAADEATIGTDDKESLRAAVARTFWDGICGPEQTCQQRLHHKTRQRVGPYWQSSWLEELVTVFQDVERDHHQLGLGGLLTLLVVALYYGHSLYVYAATRRNSRRDCLHNANQSVGSSQRQAHRILRQPPKGGTTLMRSPPPTTLIDIVHKRNKQY